MTTLIDTEQDLTRGRFNFAASRLIADARKNDGARDPIPQIGRDIVFEDALGPVFEVRALGPVERPPMLPIIRK